MPPLGKHLCAALVLATACGVARAQGCFETADPAIERLRALAARDAKAALPLVQNELESAERAAPANPSRVAAVLAVQAQSYTLLELDGDARASALAGLKLVPDPDNPIHLELQSTHAAN